MIEKPVSGNVRLYFLCSSSSAAVILLVAAILMAVEGTWSLEIFHSWPFLTFVLLSMFCCAAAAFTMFKRSIGSVSLNLFLPVALHTGFFLILCGAFFGAPDFSRLQLKADENVPRNLAFNCNGEPVLLPFHVTLQEFQIDYYKGGQKPKQFTSVLEIDGKIFKTSVNHPCKYNGYRFYQADFDRLNCKYSILILVKDPWLPVVFIGMVLMALGSLLEIKKLWKGMTLLISALVLATAFGAISLARIQFSTLMPALRSIWFIPHLIFYMMSYSLLSISLLLIVIHIVLKSNENACASRCSQIFETAMKCLKTSSFSMLLGMLFGAVWAKYAWGDYWTWDAKECWAAATWLLTLVAIHASCGKSDFKAGILLPMILAAFIAMQMTWYGVESLPSAANSIHTYNTTRVSPAWQ